VNEARSAAAERGWDDPVIREKRIARHAVEVCNAGHSFPWMRFTSVPKAFRVLRINTHADPLKDATAKAVRLVIAQGGVVTIRGFQFRLARKEN
jgi:hypothetical protein